MSSNGADYESGDLAGAVRGVGRWIDEGWGEISGRNYERQKDNEASDLQAAKDAAEAQMARERLRAQRVDVAASKTAEAIQNTARTTQSNAMESPMLGERDFLGL